MYLNFYLLELLITIEFQDHIINSCYSESDISFTLCRKSNHISIITRKPIFIELKKKEKNADIGRWSRDGIVATLNKLKDLVLSYRRILAPGKFHHRVSQYNNSIDRRLFM